MATNTRELLLLRPEQREFYETNGFLRVENVFSPAEIARLSEELEYIMQVWAAPGRGWEGPWRQKYLTAEQEQKSQLTAIHELQSYAAAWARAIVNPRLADAVADLIGPGVEFHHSMADELPIPDESVDLVISSLARPLRGSRSLPDSIGCELRRHLPHRALCRATEDALGMSLFEDELKKV